MRKRATTASSAILGCTILLLIPSPFANAAGAVSHSQYRAVIEECRVFLGKREIDPKVAQKLAVTLRAIHQVKLPSGQLFPVDTRPDADALDAISGTTPDKKLQQRFEALSEQLATSPGRVVTTSADKVATQVLQANEFRSSRPVEDNGKGWDWSFLPTWLRPIAKFFEPAWNWIASAFSRLGKWFGKAIENSFRAIGKFFRWIFNKFPQNKWRWNAKNPFASLGNGVLLTLFFLATVAAVVGFYFLTRYLVDQYEIRTGRRRMGSMLGSDLDLTEEGITDPLGTARERAVQGDYRAAIRLTYIAALWKLAESGAIVLEKNRTNWEYQRSLREQFPEIGGQLLPATRLFDRIWYGKQSGTRSEFETVSAIYENLPAQSPVIPAENQSTGGTS